MTWESLFDVLNRDNSDTHTPPGPPRPSSPRDSSSISPNDSDLSNSEPSYDDSFIFEDDLCKCECGAYHSESEGNPSKSFEDEVFEEVFEECIASDQITDVDEGLNDPSTDRQPVPDPILSTTRALAYILPPTPTEAERNEIWDAAMSVRDRPYARRLILEKQGGLSEEEEEYMRMARDVMGDGMGGDAEGGEEGDSTQELDNGSRMAANDEVDGETDCQWDSGSDSDLGSEATLTSKLEAINGEYEYLNERPPSAPARFERESKTSGLTNLKENVSEEVIYPAPASASTSKPTPFSTSTFDTPDEDEDENHGGGPGQRSAIQWHLKSGQMCRLNLKLLKAKAKAKE
ncbi:hypothetical protein NLJ89_g11212 [Agrocybe chaxingu]|uniref:Uncharacterized protein n=1 Tax=Agrocybe chaxingu TaxID=84603 RepID=A0A9W8JMA8_9AGAR|nr:hypothetical protein NLJ89_g11212 [Agrocybe chaxingu]